jgi:hypothetical protein
MKNLKIALPAFALLALSASALAGSSQVEIKCQSASGKTKILASVPGDDSTAFVTLTLPSKVDATKTISTSYLNTLLLEDMKLNNEDPTVLFPGYQTAVFSVIEHPDLGAYSINVLVQESGFDNSVLTLTAKATTLKIRDRSDSSRQGTFEALLEAVDPRTPNHSASIAPIAVSCTYFYSI